MTHIVDVLGEVYHFYSRACFVPSLANRWNSFLWLASTETFPARVFFHGIHRLTGCCMLRHCSVATARLGLYRDGASVLLLLLRPVYHWQLGYSVTCEQATFYC